MKLRQTGPRALGWMVWVLLGWVFLRGVLSLLPATPAQAGVREKPEAQVPAEPVGLDAFPAIFIHEYLTWQSGNPDEHALRIAPYLTRSLDRRPVGLPARRRSGSWRRARPCSRTCRAGWGS
jgi:hypothetical protein